VVKSTTFIGMSFVLDKKGEAASSAVLRSQIKASLDLAGVAVPSSIRAVTEPWVATIVAASAGGTDD
jgi:hypothetical protein